MITTVCSFPSDGPGDHGRHADFGNPSGITPLLSQTAAGHRPGDTPWESQPEGGRRFTSHPEPATYGTLQAIPVANHCSHTSRRFIRVIALCAAHARELRRLGLELVGA